MFLTKTGEASNRLQLKIYEAGCIPLMKLASVEVEEKAGDKRAFVLLYVSFFDRRSYFKILLF